MSDYQIRFSGTLVDVGNINGAPGIAIRYADGDDGVVYLTGIDRETCKAMAQSFAKPVRLIFEPIE